MLRNTLGKLMSVGRMASAVFGLALVLALIVRAASMAFIANGEPFSSTQGAAPNADKLDGLEPAASVMGSATALASG